jgi:broad specificity phosphatase PhoE
MSSPTRLLLLRHGEVESRYHRVFGGRIDMELSPQGHQQATALAEYVRKIPLDAIYVSPMKRAQQTVAPLLAHLQREASTMADLCEVHFGDWTGLTWQEVHDKYQVSAFQWLEMMEAAKVPGGECSRTFRARIEPCLQHILESHPGQTIAVTCHGGVIRMLLSILLQIPLPKMAAFEIEYASVTEVLHSPEKTTVELLNFTPWRDLK